MQRFLLKDLSALTQIRDKLLDKMTLATELCICDYINEIDIVDEDVLDINIGFGTISILVLDDELKYSFKPSKSFENKLIKTIENKESPLVSAIEYSLENKISTTYKDLI